MNYVYYNLVTWILGMTESDMARQGNETDDEI